MIIYWLTFLISFSSYHFSFYFRKKVVSFFLKGIAVIIPSLVAAFRDLDVGKDIATYGLQTFDLAIKSNSFANPFDLFRDQAIEIGYIIVNMIVSFFSTSYHVLFFVLQFIVLVLTVVGCELLKKNLKQPQWLFLMYLLFNYCMSFSMLRQSIALAVFIVSIRFLLDRKVFLYSLFIFIGFLFHKSILFVYPVYFVPILLEKYPKVPWYAVLALLGVGLYFFFPSLVPWGISIGVIEPKYMRYVDDSFSTHKNNMAFFAFTFFYFFLISKIKNLTPLLKYKQVLICSLSICAFMIELCGSYNDVASRVAKYIFLLILVLWFDFFPAFQEKWRINRHVVLLVAFMFVYFLYNSQSPDGLANTIPYRSSILGI